MTRLLFVDDDPAILRIFQRMFTRPDTQVDVAQDAVRALPLIEKNDYDVVISDFSMPGMSGAELLARACELRPDSMRILVTAHTDFGAAVAAINRGEVFRIARKPWDDDDLRFSLKLAVETRRANLERREMARQLAEKNGALATANARLRQLNQRLDAAVQQRTVNLLDALINALDFRDTETLNHSKRVSAYARRLGEELRLSSHELVVVAQGALLHDIGKIGVPDAVLLKPGKLDEQEWELMRRHPALGSDLLAPIEFLREAREIVFQHHERFDGGGYPSRIAGDAICIGARIFAVVDTYDAITSDRPYRKGAPYAPARAEILRVTGSQLDPVVTEAFARISEAEWHKIREEVEHGSSTATMVCERSRELGEEFELKGNELAASILPMLGQAVG